MTLGKSLGALSLGVALLAPVQNAAAAHNVEFREADTLLDTTRLDLEQAIPGICAEHEVDGMEEAGANRTFRSVKKAYKSLDILNEEAVRTQMCMYDESWISELSAGKQAEARHEYAYTLYMALKHVVSHKTGARVPHREWHLRDEITINVINTKTSFGSMHNALDEGEIAEISALLVEAMRQVDMALVLWEKAGNDTDITRSQGLKGLLGPISEALAN